MSVSSYMWGRGRGHQETSEPPTSQLWLNPALLSGAMSPPLPLAASSARPLGLRSPGIKLSAGLKPVPASLQASGGIETGPNPGKTLDVI